MNSKIKNKELQVAALQEGTVIDHIPVDKLFAAVTILNLAQMPNKITIGFNLESKKYGKKGIIKISNCFFDDDVINKIALVAPSCKLSIIKDYEVIEKRIVRLPDEFVGVCKCINPKCITNSEPMNTRFHVVGTERKLLRCHYCEQEMNRDEVKLL